MPTLANRIEDAWRYVDHEEEVGGVAAARGLRRDERTSQAHARTSGPRDAVAKGRIASGERASRAKLTGAEVRELRRLHSEGVTRKTLAARFKITPENVSQIVLRRTWRAA